MHCHCHDCQRGRRKFRLVVAIVLLAILAVLALTACSPLQAVRRAAIPPVATVVAGGTTVEQRGEASTPASARTEEKRQSVTLPAGTVVWQDERTGTIRYRLGTDTKLEAVTTVEQATAPAAFTPPKPPTVAEEAEAKADFWSDLGLKACILVGAVGALWGFTQHWPMVAWGGVAIAGGGLFGLFVQRHPLLLILIGLGIALKVAGPLLWHTKLKHVQP